MPCAVNPKSARAPDVDIFFFASLCVSRRPLAPSHVGHPNKSGSPSRSLLVPVASRETARTSFGNKPPLHVGWSAPSHVGHVPAREAPATNVSTVRGFDGVLDDDDDDD
jgi:hypothetical protein